MNWFHNISKTGGRTRWLMVVLVGLFLASVTILWLFFRDAQADTLNFEVAKALLQLGVVSMVGVVISLFTFEYQRERKLLDKELDESREVQSRKLDYREDLLKTTLAKTTAEYSTVKKSRRLLRARAIKVETKGGSQLDEEGEEEATFVLGAEYDSQMDMVNDAQSEIESLVGDVQTSARAFTNPDALVEKLRSMESYLGNLIEEYETERRGFGLQETTLGGQRELSELPQLADFISYKRSKFRTRFVNSYHGVQKGIRADLLYPQADRSPSSPD
jgi:hypothetical protein